MSSVALGRESPAAVLVLATMPRKVAVWWQVVQVPTCPATVVWPARFSVGVLVFAVPSPACGVEGCTSMDACGVRVALDVAPVLRGRVQLRLLWHCTLLFLLGLLVVFGVRGLSGSV